MRTSSLLNLLAICLFAFPLNAKVLFHCHYDNAGSSTSNFVADFAAGSGSVTTLTQVAGCPFVTTGGAKFGDAGVRVQVGYFDQVELSYNAFDNMYPKKGSFEAWIKFTYTSRNSRIFYVSEDGQLFDLYLNASSDRLEFKVTSGGVTKTAVTPTSSINTNTWYYVSVDWDLDNSTTSENKIRIWLNGDLKQTQTGLGVNTMAFESGDEMGIFSYTWASYNSLRGYGDEVRITNELIPYIYGDTVNSSNDYTTPTKALTSKFYDLYWYEHVETYTPGVSSHRSEGMNATIAYCDTTNYVLTNFKENENYIKNFLDACKNYNIKAYLEIPRQMVKTSTPYVGKIQSYVNYYKDHEALYGWYLCDEPELSGGASPTSLATSYSTVKGQCLANQDVLVVFCNEDDFSPDYTGTGSSQCYDIVAHDRYPVTMTSSEFGNLSDWRVDCLDVAGIGTATRPIFTAGQAYGNEDDGGDCEGDGYDYYIFERRSPTYREFRHMVWASVYAGMEGWVNYGRYFAVEDADLTSNVITPVMDSVFLNHDYAVDDPWFTPVSFNGPDTYGCLLKHNSDGTYLLVTIRDRLTNASDACYYRKPTVNPSYLDVDYYSQWNWTTNTWGNTYSITSSGEFQNGICYKSYDVHIFKVWK